MFITVLLYYYRKGQRGLKTPHIFSQLLLAGLPAILAVWIGINFFFPRPIWSNLLYAASIVAMFGILEIGGLVAWIILRPPRKGGK